MADPAPSAARCGIDTVEIARIERLLRETPPEDLFKIFSPEELRDSGDGPGRAASPAARFAAKKLVPSCFCGDRARDIAAADWCAIGAGPRNSSRALTRRMRLAPYRQDSSLSHDRAARQP
jgi:hypothetical protein